MIEKILKIIIAILLLLCLFHMPYGYYQLVRFVAMSGFLFLGFKAYERNEKNLMILFLILALLFQPLIKIALGRQVWNIVDVVIALFLIASLFPQLFNRNSSHETG